MSLDVYLKQPGTARLKWSSGIFVRENGATVEISREEWDRRYPGREPVTWNKGEVSDNCYHRNITHNLNAMAEAAGIYRHIWRPDEIGVTHARMLIEPLAAGLCLLRGKPELFERFNPENGWGSYDGLVAFVADYLKACIDHPDAVVDVSR